MVCKALTVLTAVVKIERHSHIFADVSQLSNICERVALPNIGLRRELLMHMKYKNEAVILILFFL